MNKKNKILIVIVLVILVLVVIFYFIYKKQKPPVAVPVETNPNEVVYYCQEGIIKAIYGKNDVRLTLKDGSSVTLPHSISADGARYELGTKTFWSKGDNAFLTENNKQTYTNCVTGIQATEENTNTYTDASKTFSFSYPNQFTLSGGEIGYSQDWRARTTDLGLLLTVVHVPQSFLPNTNFGEAKFTVGTSTDPKAVKNCLISDNRNMEVVSEVVLGSRNFTKVLFTDVGAGQYYDTASYRTIYNNQCYAIEYTVHSANIYNYSPDQGIKEFDKTKIDSVLESIVQSFKFI
jgi:membrane-bound inhibitor of C-type lysozyme